MDVCNKDGKVSDDKNTIAKILTSLDNKRIPQLEALRFVMCLTIVLSHFEFLYNSESLGTFYKQYIHNPTLAVNYFFSMSGFGMFLSTKRPRTSFKSSIVFAIKKVKGIYVAYIISLVMGSIYYVVSRNEGLFEAIAKMLAYFCIDACFLQSLTGMSVVTNSLNGVCWFMSSLFFCYLLSPLMLSLCDIVKKKSKGQCIAMFWVGVLALFIISKIFMCIDDAGFLRGRVDNFCYSHPFVRVWYVFLGMMTGIIFEKFECRCGSLLEIFCGIVAFSYFIYGNSMRDVFEKGLILKDVFSIFGFVLPCFVILVFAKGKGVVSKFLRRFSFLGSLSSLIYLFHYPIRMMTDWIFNKNGIVSKMGESAYFFEIVLILVFTIFFIAVYRLLMKQKGLNKEDKFVK